MLALVLLAIAVSFAVAMPLAWLARAIGTRLGHLDSAGVPGQVKTASRRIPNTGGIAIFWGVAAPMLAVVAAVHYAPGTLTDIAPSAAVHLDGLRSQSSAALIFLACLFVLHVVGLIDDRRPLGPWIKLVIMLGCALAVVLGTDSRMFTLLDARAGGGGPWLSIIVTVLWIAVVTNAMNFIDNMDGLSAGVATIAGGCFMAATLTGDTPQWFVAGSLALLVGACLGFLVFNFPRRAGGGATIFMGDGGSLVIGFTLAFLTVRTTYYDPQAAGGWYAVLMPLVVLAVPLYDFASVCIIRVRAGRSPFVGDLNHLSHRFERRGLSRRDSVLVIYGLTGITALGGVSLASLQPWQAALVGAQTLLVLVVLGLYERRVGGVDHGANT